MLVIACFPDHDQRRDALRWPGVEQLAVGLGGFQRIVLRLEAADIENVAPRLQTEAGEHVGIRLVGELGAVWDDRGLRTEGLPVVAGDNVGVGHAPAGEGDGERLATCIDRLSEHVPLAAAALDAIDVDGYRDPRGAQQREHEGIRGIADQHGVEIAPQRIERREQAMADGLEVLVADSRKLDALDALPLRERQAPRPTRAPAVDGHIVTAQDQPASQFRGEGLEAAIARRNAARAEDGELQWNHFASSRSRTRRRRWTSRLFANIRRRFFHSHVKAGSEVRSIATLATTATISRVSSKTPLRRAR